ncbi:2Fe-2S iron-sulfur cluster binding domain-containing protein [Bacillus sp. V3B]|uniref:2Fe-2S iron-sulfur cluster-binding protein n=1 Tax=Bacillus sp. V3B TaxID=2804915 RepID=UPI0021096723|nr:2Fe-2S iron-sulfur cluster-binding protein [Bacillus sp. V3B]MCQ6275463.1 2Fe-2S iron-sulfur cluster binding domain-containing protein [Bacillus sp. V3B]
MFKITLNNESFLCPETMTIVEAAKIQTAKVPYGCIGGGCGICKMKVVEGQYKLDNDAKNALSDEERKNGFVFLCKTYPLSDLQLEWIRK